MDAVRHRRCRSIVSAPPHGFTLRASPAVKHGVSPPGTVDERAEILCLLPSPRIACSLADTLTLISSNVSYIVLQILSTHCIAYHRHHIPYMVLKTLSLIASPTTLSAYRIWSCRYSHPLHRLTPSPYIVYGLIDILTLYIA